MGRTTHYCVMIRINLKNGEKARLLIKSAVIQDRYIREEWRTNDKSVKIRYTHSCYKGAIRIRRRSGVRDICGERGSTRYQLLVQSGRNTIIIIDDAGACL